LVATVIQSKRLAGVILTGSEGGCNVVLTRTQLFDCHIQDFGKPRVAYEYQSMTLY